ncbi:MAG TPA: cytochrome c [Steroidobacteraceae bacterium]|nr:cytochrome c [Steroidobacteraceae bacterium]
MNRHAKSLLAVAWLAVIPLAAVAEDAPAKGAQLAYTCLGCHGIENYKNSYPKYSVPKLGGQHKAYIEAALKEYRDGSRWHPTMHGYASTLSDEDIAELAAWFSSRASKPADNIVAGTPPAKASICVACHGQNGFGTMDEYPNLAGQHEDYLAQALNDYRRGKRKNPIMQPFASQLTPEEIAELAKFFAAQEGLKTPHQE